ncbi:MAG TPA: hypothetical protein VEI97_15885, partial [bacterium]|nr:hypothetical protein [bacterium]
MNLSDYEEKKRLIKEKVDAIMAPIMRTHHLPKVAPTPYCIVDRDGDLFAFGFETPAEGQFYIDEVLPFSGMDGDERAALRVLPSAEVDCTCSNPACPQDAAPPLAGTLVGSAVIEVRGNDVRVLSESGDIPETVRAQMQAVAEFVRDHGRMPTPTEMAEMPCVKNDPRGAFLPQFMEMVEAMMR